MTFLRDNIIMIDYIIYQPGVRYKDIEYHHETHGRHVHHNNENRRYPKSDFKRSSEYVTNAIDEVLEIDNFDDAIAQHDVHILLLNSQIERSKQ